VHQRIFTGGYPHHPRANASDDGGEILAGTASVMVAR
jgi:hypothetical protein